MSSTYARALLLFEVNFLSNLIALLENANITQISTVLGLKDT